METVVGRGYRFVAQVKVAETESESKAVNPAPIPAAEKPAEKPASRAVWPSLLALTIPGILLAVYLVSRGQPIAPMKLTPLTALPGSELSPTFSPDGGRVAFSWRSQDGSAQHIYVKRIGSDAPERLTSSGGSDSDPSWSPDGRRIAFLRESEQHEVALWAMTTEGGDERQVRVLARPNRFPPAWTPDGSGLVVADSSETGRPPSLVRVSLRTGEMLRITTAQPTGNGDWHAVYSPDGQRLAYERNMGSLVASSLYVARVNREGLPIGEPRPVDIHISDTLGLAWSADGRSLIAPSRSGLLRLPVAGGRAAFLPILDAAQVAVSRKLDRLVYSQVVTDTDVFRIGGPGHSEGPERLIASTRMDGAADYSPDGQRIVFVSERSGMSQIWVADREGKNARQVTGLPGGTAGTPRWSPDGRWIAFDAIEEGRARVLIVPDGGMARRITAGPWNDVRPSWSRNSEWVYFGSDRTEQWEIWKTRLAGGEPVQVTHEGGREAVEDSQGTFLYYTKDRNERGIWRMPCGGGREEKISAEGSQGTWAIGARGLYYVPEQNEIRLLELPGGRISPIASGGLDLHSHTGRLLAVAPGDRWILVTGLVRSDSDLTLVENFR